MVALPTSEPFPKAPWRFRLIDWDPPAPVLLVLSALVLTLAARVARDTPTSSPHPTTDAWGWYSEGSRGGRGGIGTLLAEYPAASTARAASRPSRGQCLTSLDDLHPAERRPSAGPRHVVDPPSDVGRNISLVCCETTAGPLSISVHESWAQNGAARFLDMVGSGYFDSRVPLHRCAGGRSAGLCQFGVGGYPRLDRRYRSKRIPDDPNWLPMDVENLGGGMKRFARGYLAYVADTKEGGGDGKNGLGLRSSQFIVSLKDQNWIGAEAWEVPWGELVGRDSYATLGRIFTGYGENGPGLKLLREEGSSRNVAALFPMMDYITGCWITDQVQVKTGEQQGES